MRLRASTGFDGARLETLLAALDAASIAPEARADLRAYLAGLAGWAQAHRVGNERRLGQRDEFPHELALLLARSLVRLAAITGDGTCWVPVKRLELEDRDGDLASAYLDAVAGELIASSRAPDDLFWAAWWPTARWVMETLVRPRGPGDWDQLGNAVGAAGFVGAYLTPLPPEWPHLEALLPTIM